MGKNKLGKEKSSEINSFVFNSYNACSSMLFSISFFATFLSLGLILYGLVIQFSFILQVVCNLKRRKRLIGDGQEQ